MAHVTYDVMWREAVMQLLDQLEAENPEDPSLAPKARRAARGASPACSHPRHFRRHAGPDLAEWSVIYIRYLQIFRRLETAYDQIAHPQKRQDVRRALEACMGRMLEVRHWMVKLNRGLDAVSLDDVLLDLKLPPEVLEVPVPRYFVEDRAQELGDRDKFLGALLEKYGLQAEPRGGEPGPAAQQPQQQDEAAAGAAAEGGGGGGAAGAQQLSPSQQQQQQQQQQRAKRAAAAINPGPPLPLSEALAVIATNERGRQARERAARAAARRRQQQLQDRRGRGGGAPLGRQEAAVRIQSAVRGFLWRARVKRTAQQELEFIGMLPHPPDPSSDPQAREAATLVARKRLQLEHLRDYDGALPALKGKVKEAEGQDMREAVQDKINAWFIQKRDPATGAYPDFPDASSGGSKAILNPPPPTLESLLADAAAAEGGKAGKGGKGKPAGGGKQGAGAGADKKGAAKGGKGGKDAGAEGAAAAVEETIGSAFVPLIEAVVADYVAKWQDRDESSNAEQRFDPELAKEELRPLVFDEVREQVDAEMRALLSNLKDMVEAELAAKAGKKKKGGGKGGKKGAKKEKGAAGKKDKKGKGGKGGKKKKDPTGDRSMESLYAELVSNGILVKPQTAHVADYLGGPGLMGATLERAGIVPDASMAQIRQAVAEYAALPLGSASVHERLPYVKTLLLFGAERTGKSLLSHAVASMTGANFFDLSPRNTDGRYPGKAAAMLAHMVFKVARTMAPSVIWIDEVEKVFVSDKKKAKEFGGQEPPSRIKKDLLREVKSLRPGDRVLLIGNSREPWLAAKKDERAFLGFWGKALHLPLPDYASRRLLWPGLFARHGARLPYGFDVSTLAHLSEGYSAGAMDAAVRGLLSAPRLARLRRGGAGAAVGAEEILQWLSRVRPVPREADEALRAWADKTPALAAIRGAAAAAAAGDKPASAGGGKKKGKGGDKAGGGKKKKAK
ncbi:hypothetical protein Rsub_07531 [Raphidocelis subcapitata]|uniref:ATPase AAA-type core domain-containing protein n=1 Tax=Raphidocelis subcapitata TaxID=307507 RepID=A0A2V0PAX7_9CHLO|nr:hypothetical protein Rsub_07531 [Raphidocelis subcapitata]|eukprot:GBF95030.1 hypothetical protein Rsub_07531 [Raphidocelis subcapitata]